MYISLCTAGWKMYIPHFGWDPGIKQVITRGGRALKKILHVLLMSLKGTLISRLIEKVGKSHPRTALGIAHQTYYGDIGRSISCSLRYWMETMRYL